MYKNGMVKRIEILKNARVTFADKGYFNVTMKDISDACQIARSSLYHYTLSVNAIYEDMIKEKKLKLQTNTNVLDNFLDDLKYELINVDKTLYRAIVVYVLANKTE